MTITTDSYVHFAALVALGALLWTLVSWITLRVLNRTFAA